jgi:glycogen synthase
VNKAGTILQIVPRAQPGRDGVGDYARTLAASLERHHGLKTTFVFAAEDSRPIFPSGAYPGGAGLDHYDAIVLHYVNYGYGQRGVPLWLPPALRRLQRASGARQITVFHELYASGSWRQSAFWLRPLQMRIARAVAAISDVSVVSSEVSRQQLESLDSGTRIIVHPVNSGLGEPVLSPAEIASRDPHRWVICGGTELIERSLRSYLPAVALIPEPLAPRELLVIGGSDNPRVRQTLDREKKIRTHYYPEVDAKVASEILASCAFGWIDYFHRPDIPMPLILKSTAFAAYCAHGVIPVFPHGGATIALDEDALPGPFFVATTGQELPGEAERATAAQAVYSWYGRNATAVHLAATLAPLLGSAASPLKILISSHAFAPSVGGIETVSELLAEEFVRLGHMVTVVTQTADDQAEEPGYLIVRRPLVRQLFPAIKWCDVSWQNNLSLRTIWPALLLRKPIVITHQGSYCRQPNGLDLVQRIKHTLVERTTSVAISRAVAACFRTNSTIIPNPYDARIFVNTSLGQERPLDLIFLGRLVTEKGIDLLLDALARLRESALFPRLTIVGPGPERFAMEEMAAKLGLGDQVTFVGSKGAAEVAHLLQQHKILVIPSRYDEPFGVAALEGIACGCVAVGSAGGGLPEAIGPCGLTFPNGDVNALARTLEKLLRTPDELQRLAAHASEHLAKFQPAVIAEAYLTLFRSHLP